MGKAAELLFTGDFMEADEGYRLGFLNHIVEEDELESKTMDMARKIAAGPPIAIRLSKLMLYKGLEFDLETALKMAAAAETITLTSVCPCQFSCGIASIVRSPELAVIITSSKEDDTNAVKVSPVSTLTTSRGTTSVSSSHIV